MKKICFILCCLFMLFSLTSCGKVDEADAKALLDSFFGYVEQGEYDAASDLLCGKDDKGKSLAQFLDEIEKERNIDFQSGIEITKTEIASNGPSSYYGLNIIDFRITASIGNKEAFLSVDVLEDEDGLEISSIIVYDGVTLETGTQFLPDKD